jgi:hypothetical protein
MSDKTVKLPCFGIVVELTDMEPHALTPNRYGGGSITSDLKEKFGPSPCQLSKEECDVIDRYNDMMDALESIIMAHACAGIDIESSAYIEGIETSVQSCADNI